LKPGRGRGLLVEVTPFLLVLACTGSGPPPPPTGSTTLVTDTADTGITCTTDTLSQLPEGFTRGDPITTLNNTWPQGHWETLDAAQISDDRALVVANNGFDVVDITTGEITLKVADHNGFHVEWDPTIDTAWVTTQVNEL
jgi:hypothetical protein